MGWFKQVREHRVWSKLAVLFILGIFLASPSYAQVAGATLSGTTTDSSGAVVPNVEISIKNVATGVVRTVTTDTAGFYTAPNILPGNYEISAAASGFSTAVQSNVTLTVGLQQVQNFVLQVGQMSQSVQVTTEAIAVQLSSSSIGGEVNETTVRELPLNGRDWTQLASLEPGVNAVPTQLAPGANANRGNRGFGNQLTISGTRPQHNNYRLDGISVVDYAGGSPGSVIGIALGVDAISEFSVITSNYSAEYGRTSGGVINAITRSGADAFHGGVYEFVRNSAFDARNYFDGKTIPPFRRNQFGGDVGGPIIKQKLFFFFDYEGFRQNLGVTNKDLVPSAAAKSGLLNFASSAAFPSGCVGNGVSGSFNGNPYVQCAVSVSPVVVPYLGFWPAATGAVGGSKDLGNTGTVLIPVQIVANENYETARGDYHISNNDIFAVSWFHDSSIFDAPDKLKTWIVGNTGSRHFGSLEETHTFSPTLVNTVRFGFSRVVALSNQAIAPINPATADTSLGSFPGRPSPGINVTGLTGFAGGLLGLSAPNHIWNSFQLYDDAFLTKGAHSIKFGFAMERMQHNFSVYGNINGLFSFSSLANLLEAHPLSFKAQIPTSFTAFGVRQTLFGGYVQDDWRFKSNLTVNLGLRYEMVTVPTEIANRLENIRTITSPTAFLGSPFFNNPTKLNFEPRVGFAWDPFRNGKTSVRGAFGIFDVLPLNYEFFNGLNTAQPYVESLFASNLVQGDFPTAVVGKLGVNQSALAASYIENSPKRNYVMIWNLNIQRQLTASTTLTLGYVGNKGVHMLNREDDVNETLPTSTSAGLLWPTVNGGANSRVNPAFGQLRGDFWGGDANYNALQAGIRKQLGHGIQAQGSYTWGKGIDTGSASVVGDPFQNSISTLYWFCKACRRGLSDYDIKHTFVGNVIWDVPGPKNWGAFANHTLEGWQVGGIVTAETGVPFTPKMGGDPLGLNNFDPYDFPNRSTGSGCASTVTGNPSAYINLNCFSLPMATPAIAAQCRTFGTIAGSCANLFGNSGRNSVPGPGLTTVDFSLFKNNYIPKISEVFNIQFRFEAFNVLNHPNFEPPINNSTLFDTNGVGVPGAGAVDTTSTTSRQLQLGLKVVF
jgi:hypothetical protein